MLGVFSSSQILFYLALILGWSMGTVSLFLGIVLLAMKWLIQQSVNYGVMKKLKENDLFWKFPILDILFFVYLLILPIYYFINKNKSTWN